MMKKFKKMLAVTLVTVLAASVISCGKNTTYVATNGDETVSAGVYIMALEREYQNATEHKDFDDTLEDPLKNEIEGMNISTYVEQKATEELTRYLAVEKLFTQRELAFEIDKMTELEKQMEAYWDQISGYYEKLGVSKNSWYDSVMNTEKKTILFESYYDKEGSEEVSEADLKKYFADEYLGYVSIIFPLPPAEEGSEVSDADKNKVKQTAQSYLERLQQGEDVLTLKAEWEQLEQQRIAKENDEKAQAEGTSEASQAGSEDASGEASSEDQSAVSSASEVTSEPSDEPDTTSDEPQQNELSDVLEILKRSLVTEGTISEDIAAQAKIAEPIILSDDSAYYLVYRYDVLEQPSLFTDYQEQLLLSMKTDDFDALLLQEGNTLSIELNQAAVKRYSVAKYLEKRGY